MQTIVQAIAKIQLIASVNGPVDGATPNHKSCDEVKFSTNTTDTNGVNLDSAHDREVKALATPVSKRTYTTFL